MSAYGGQGNSHAKLMIMKTLVWVSLFIGSVLGGWLGAALDQGNWLGLTSILLGEVGSLAGIWAGYKVSKNYL